ncbi:hypothetical protein CMEL01_02548 [Colletotrichum melonis]|uniref:Uncharacterized protein n=1 Tax=Colletotrichum melonis TaxID=1209925 RepID=A0AAI9XTF8_9PEZI|nr:hypothetical protein CMEL01_02548 [Colletotrichum melonis]
MNATHAFNLGQLLKPCTSLKDHVKAAIPSIRALVKGSLTAAIFADEMCLSRTAIITTTGAIGASHEGAVMIVAPKRAIDVLNFELNSHFGRGWSTTVYPSRTSAQLEEVLKPRTHVLAVNNMNPAELIQGQCHYF